MDKYYYEEDEEQIKAAEIKKKAEEKKKQEAEKLKKPQKQWWIVKIEGDVPAIFEFRVHAESEDVAFDIVHRTPNLAQLMGPPKFDIFRIKKRRVTIKNTLGTLINWIRNF